MSLHFHIGAHKTASTHLQATLRRNAAEIEAAGARLAPPEEVRALAGGAMRAAAGRGPFSAMRARIGAARLARLPSAARLIVSDENAPGLIDEILETGALYPSARARLVLFRRLASDRSAVVWLGLRAYPSFFAGVHAHSLIGRRAAPVSSVMRARLAALPRRWPDLVADAVAALPGARVVVWDHADHAALLPRILEEMTGLAGLAPVHRRPMATPSAAAMDAFFASGHLVTRADFRAADFEGPAYDPFTGEQRAAMNAAFAEDLETLAGTPGVERLRPDQAAR